MKNTFLSIILFSITSLITAQELPNIPIKNGMTFHSFDHKLENQKKCLSNYFTFSSTTSAIREKLNTQASGITVFLTTVSSIIPNNMYNVRYILYL